MQIQIVLLVYLEMNLYMRRFFYPINLHYWKICGSIKLWFPIPQYAWPWQDMVKAGVGVVAVTKASPPAHQSFPAASAIFIVGLTRMLPARPSPDL